LSARYSTPTAIWEKDDCRGEKKGEERGQS
jgi:hypothetical protein